MSETRIKMNFENCALYARGSQDFVEKQIENFRRIAEIVATPHIILETDALPEESPDSETKAPQQDELEKEISRISRIADENMAEVRRLTRENRKLRQDGKYSEKEREILWRKVDSLTAENEALRSGLAKEKNIVRLFCNGTVL